MPVEILKRVKDTFSKRQAQNQEDMSAKSAFNYASPSPSGVFIYGNVFNEEQFQKLRGKHGAKIYDDMRRSDATIAMLVKIVKAPVIRASWIVEPVDDSEEEVLIADFMTHVLNSIGDDRKGTRVPLRKFIADAMTMIEYGYSLFDISHKVVMGHKKYGNYIGLRNIAWRSPKTIEKWFTDKHGGLVAVEQTIDGDHGGTFRIPAKHILLNTIDGEGGNYEGISMLRPIYGNFIRKHRNHKINAVGNQKAATGGMKGSITKDAEQATDAKSNVDNFARNLEAFGASEKNTIVLKEGYSVEEIKLTHDGDKLIKSIEHENAEMAKSFFAGFMELGQNGNGGAYSLGTDLSDMFLSNLEMFGEIIAENVNHKIIKPIIDARFGVREEYPKLCVRGINDKAGKEYAEIITMLNQAGMVQKSPRLMKMLHELYGMPEYDDELPMPEEPQAEAIPLLDECCDHGHDTIVLAETPNGIKQISEHRKEFEKESREFLERQTSDMIASITKMARKESNVDKLTTDVEGLSLKGKREYKALVQSRLASAAFDANKQAVKEVGKAAENVKFADTPKELFKKLPKKTVTRIKAQSELLVRDHYAKAENAILFAFLGEVSNTDSPDQLEKVMTDSQQTFLASNTIRAAAGNLIATTVNGARNDVFQTPEVMNQIESFVYKNANPVSAICKNLNNRVFSKEEYKTTPYLPPNHHNCDSIVVPQMVNGKNNKPVSPIGLAPTGSEAEITQIMKSKSL